MNLTASSEKTQGFENSAEGLRTISTKPIKWHGLSIAVFYKTIVKSKIILTMAFEHEDQNLIKHKTSSYFTASRFNTRPIIGL